MQTLSAARPDAASQGKSETSGLSDKQLRRVATFIGREVGIQLPASKRTLVEGRLRRRLRALNFSSFSTYLDWVLSDPEGRHERLHLIDSITTNKTDFFRESEHFKYLTEIALPELESRRWQYRRQGLEIWSAGCSSGEEAYTLSIVLNEVAERQSDMRFRILATDISQSSLETAGQGIYPAHRIDAVPVPLRKKYFLRSKSAAQALVRMGPELRERIRFGSLNLMAGHFGLETKMDVIFCRNVMIYFNSQIREALVQRFEQQLVPGGYLFVGHSESLNGLKSGLEQVAPMVYRRPA
ncbi:MAG: CheR family methyltransferase [Pontibacterium sp.]